jgi:hypothetical protein
MKNKIALILLIIFIMLFQHINANAIFEILGSVRYTEVTGIVQGVNVKDGSITLFDEHGKTSNQLFRKYNFKVFYDIPTYKDNIKISVSQIRQGDSAFLRLDNNGYVVEISCTSNYTKEYGVITEKQNNYLMIKSSDGEINRYPINKDTPISRGGKGVNYEDLLVGESVNLNVYRTPNSVFVINIIVEKGTQEINNIYSATIDYYNDINSTILVRNIKYFENGVWAFTSAKGYDEISLSNDIRIFSQSTEIKKENMALNYLGKQAFIAVENSIEGEERAVVISFIDQETSNYNVFDDRIKTISRERGEIGMSKEKAKFYINEGSIIIKDGKLVKSESLSLNDKTFIVSLDIGKTSNQRAYIVDISERETSEGSWLYIGRISKINEYVDFTINSHLMFSSSRWQYDSRKRTFKLSDNTRILDEDGIVGIRDFTEFSSREYRDKIVMVAVSGGVAIAVSEAPQADNRIRGRVNVDYGQTVKDKIYLTNVSMYDQYSSRWEEGRNGEVTIKNYTIILKNGKPVDAKEIKRGDTVTIMKPDWGTLGEAVLINIE